MSDNANEVLTSLRRVIRAIDKHSKNLVKTAQVTGPQLRLMHLIANNERSTVGDLAEMMHLSQATVTTIIDRLETRQFITRVKSLEDKRKVHPKLTDAGREILNKAPTALDDSFVRRFGQLQDWEQFMIIASVKRVAELMDAGEIDAAPYLHLGSLNPDDEEL